MKASPEGLLSKCGPRYQLQRRRWRKRKREIDKGAGERSQLPKVVLECVVQLDVLFPSCNNPEKPTARRGRSSVGVTGGGLRNR
jgi:hypothetical protein